MKYVYASRSGNIDSIIKKLGIDALKLADGSEVVKEPYVLFTYSDGYGEIPALVKAFVDKNAAGLQGVIVSGDPKFGPAYGGAGKKLESEYGAKMLYLVEKAGTDEDITKIKEILETL